FFIELDRFVFDRSECHPDDFKGLYILSLHCSLHVFSEFLFEVHMYFYLSYNKIHAKGILFYRRPRFWRRSSSFTFPVFRRYSRLAPISRRRSALSRALFLFGVRSKYRLPRTSRTFPLC